MLLKFSISCLLAFDKTIHTFVSMLWLSAATIHAYTYSSSPPTHPIQGDKSSQTWGDISTRPILLASRKSLNASLWPYSGCMPGCTLAVPCRVATSTLDMELRAIRSGSRVKRQHINPRIWISEHPRTLSPLAQTTEYMSRALQPTKRNCSSRLPVVERLKGCPRAN